MGEPAKKKEPDAEGRLVKTTWREPEGMEPAFVEHLHIQRVEDKFFLTFGRIDFPLSGFPDEDSPEAWIEPVARFVVPLPAMQKIQKLVNRIVDLDETEEQ
jgi:hypothetical protein